jgi:hypothetical protein
MQTFLIVSIGVLSAFLRVGFVAKIGWDGLPS